MGAKWETSIKSCAPSYPEWETNEGDKWKTSVNSCGPRHPSVRDKWETNNIMRFKEPRVGDKCQK